MPDIETEIVYAVENRFPPNLERYDGIILSGGVEPLFSQRPWVLSELKLIERCAETDTPLLGICHGHQLIARALIGNHAVREYYSSEFGWKQIRLVCENSRLFRDLPSEFYAYCSHFHGVCNLSPDFRLLAESDFCPFHAYEGIDKPIWGIQFHPEINTPKGRILLILNSLASLKPSVAHPRNLLNARDSGIAPKIFANFAEITRAMKAEG